MRTDDTRELYVQERLQRWGQATARACMTCASGHSLDKPDKVTRVSSHRGRKKGRGLEVSKEEKAYENIATSWYLLEYVLKFLVRKHMSLDDCPKGIKVRAAFVAYKEDFSRTSFQCRILGLCARSYPWRAVWT